MTRKEFNRKYHDFLMKAVLFSEKARREGLLALEEDMVEEIANDKDIFYYGLRLVNDGIDRKFIEKVLSNIIEQEKDEYTRRLKIIKKEAVLMIQEGLNPRLLIIILNSYTEFYLNENPLFGNYVVKD